LWLVFIEVPILVLPVLLTFINTTPPLPLIILNTSVPLSILAETLAVDILDKLNPDTFDARI
jgi:hypothetical protein